MLVMAFQANLAAAFIGAVSAFAASVIAHGRFRRRQKLEIDPVEELTNRVREQGRHPVRYAVTHPVETAKRMLRG